jgi:3-oxosteroid 1-dehydrogenase
MTATFPSSSSQIDTEVDILVVGSGTGLAAALAAKEGGASVVVIEKTGLVGGSTARSGGAFWIPANPVLAERGAGDSLDRATRYLDAVVGGHAPEARWRAFLEHGDSTVRMLRRMTPLKFTWARGYSDYHPELPGGSAQGRSCEARPFDVRALGADRARLRAGVMEAPIPMPVTGGDYKWLNLMIKVPVKGLFVAAKRAIQGIGGLLLRREYVAGGQALAAGLFAGVRAAGIPVLSNTTMDELIVEKGRVVGARVSSDGTQRTITARRGVILATGGFDHDLALRRNAQSPALGAWSLGADGNTGDGIAAATAVGAGTALMDQAWWFPAIAPTPGNAPVVMLAERSLPGSFMVDGTGRRFVNEATDYMSFGQRVLQREQGGDPVGQMWLVFDQQYRDSYLLGGSIFPRMKLPADWYRHSIAVRGSSWSSLASKMRVSATSFEATAGRFNSSASAGVDEEYGRGNSAYDRYYGDPTIAPNPTLRPLDESKLYAVKVVLSDLGTCGGTTVDDRGQVLSASGVPIAGLYAIGNTAANAFGKSYPGAGATIGQGLVFGYIAARAAMSSYPVPQTTHLPRDQATGAARPGRAAILRPGRRAGRSASRGIGIE